MDQASPFADHPECRAAWDDPRLQRFEMPAIDLNEVLAERYRSSEPLTMTRALLWDAEVRKAWRPDRYIPSVVADGSTAAWNQQAGIRASLTFLRSSRQRLWLNPAHYGLILEHVHVHPGRQQVTFCGVEELTGPEGDRLSADTRQPLFHVQHLVEGDETRPRSRWHIVHVTHESDPKLAEVFAAIAGQPWLPEFVELYIRHDLGIDLQRAVE